MNAAKQTAMDHYGLTEWPSPPLGGRQASLCRGMACKIMRKEGMLLKVIAYEIGYSDVSAVQIAIKRHDLDNDRSHINALLGYFNQLKPLRGF